MTLEQVATLATLGTTLVGFGITIGRQMVREKMQDKVQDERHAQNIDRMGEITDTVQRHGEKLASHEERLDGHEKDIERLSRAL